MKYGPDNSGGLLILCRRVAAQGAACMLIKENAGRLFGIMPSIKRILLESTDVESAREHLVALMNRYLDSCSGKEFSQSGLQYALRLSCVRAFRQFFSRRTVRVTHFDMVKVLWQLAREQWDAVPANLSLAFFADVCKLLEGVAGCAGIYGSRQQSSSVGRAAAIERSAALNELCAESDLLMQRYRNGLEDNIKRQREQNQTRIMQYFQCSAQQFADYRWQLQHIIRDTKVLGAIVELSGEEIEAIDTARAAGIPFGITPYYATLFDPIACGDDMAVRAQVIPPLSYVRGLLDKQCADPQSIDFMKEADTSPIDLVTRRYPRIAVFKPYNTCSQICVYCQRNWEIDDAYAPAALAPAEKIEQQ
jgi:lysine 2,3-aminomutase